MTGGAVIVDVVHSRLLFLRHQLLLKLVMNSNGVIAVNVERLLFGNILLRNIREERRNCIVLWLCCVVDDALLMLLMSDWRTLSASGLRRLLMLLLLLLNGDFH